MREVRTDRSLWKDVILWTVAGELGALLLGSILGVIPFIGWIFSSIIWIVVVIALTVYLCIYYVRLVKDLNAVCSYVEGSDEDNSWNYLLVFLVTVVTLGTYGLYWFYKQGNRLQKALKKYGIKSDESGVVYFLWDGLVLFFGGFVAWYLLIKNLNKACIAYKRGGWQQGGQWNYSSGGGDWNGKMNGVPVDAGAAGSSDETEARPVIAGLAGEYANQEVIVSPGEKIVMGRDADNVNLVFSSEKISKLHCTITFNVKENCYYITDFSKNGTVLGNGKKLTPGVTERVSRGTKITLAGSEIFQLR